MRNLMFFIAALVAISAQAASAQQSGTPEDRAACSPSVHRFCAAAISGGDMVVLNCLQQNRSRISRACQQVLVKYGQ